MLRHRAFLALFAVLSIVPFGPPLLAKDSLVIGAAQFPSSLHPFIDAEAIKYYVLGFALRPITALDTDAKPVCMLCTDVPTIENGLARIEDQPNGEKGMAVTIKLKPDLK
jgi:peptide/nickel transport system substrate-binding protein